MPSALSSIFWGLLTLCFLVYIHEAGHFFAARICGFRVTEFFLGLASSAKLSWKSKKYGTEFGITPILLGGYNKICGMETDLHDHLEDVFKAVMEGGTITYSEIAEKLDLDEELVVSNLATLVDWAAIQPFYDHARGEKPSDKDWPQTFMTVNRDNNFLTNYDKKHSFSDGIAHVEGMPQLVDGDFHDFFLAEKKRTYVGGNFFQRLFVILAGPTINIVFALAVITAVLSGIGVQAPSDNPVVGAVAEKSLAAEAGLKASDKLIAIDGQHVATFTDAAKLIEQKLPQSDTLTIQVERNGAPVDVTVNNSQHKDKLGIYASVENKKLPLSTAFGASINYFKNVVEFASRLLVPTQTLNVLNSSSSVVGISVMASHAAAAGLVALLFFMANISMSLGVMNLLPIPPLDGGKILLEILELIRRKPLSMKAQTVISLIGIGFFIFVFVYALRLDILRFILGS